MKVTMASAHSTPAPRSFRPLCGVPSNTRPLLALLFLGVMSAGASVAAIIPCAGIVGNLVSNCSFEDGAGFQGGWSDLSPVNNDYEALGSAFGITPADGSYIAAFGDYANNPGTLSQTLATTAGQDYSITFDFAELGGNNNSLKLEFGGTTLATMNNISNTTSTEVAYDVTASSSSTVLEFLGGSDPYYVFVDNASVVAVASAPEPADWLLMASGLLTVGVLRRKLRAFAHSCTR